MNTREHLKLLDKVLVGQAALLELLDNPLRQLAIPVTDPEAQADEIMDRLDTAKYATAITAERERIVKAIRSVAESWRDENGNEPVAQALEVVAARLEVGRL
jgi:hypothetical protein